MAAWACRARRAPPDQDTAKSHHNATIPPMPPACLLQHCHNAAARCVAGGAVTVHLNGVQWQPTYESSGVSAFAARPMPRRASHLSSFSTAHPPSRLDFTRWRRAAHATTGTRSCVPARSALSPQDHAVVRLDNVPFRASPAGARVVLDVGAPCASPDAFAGPQGGALVYALANSTAAECCPINRCEGRVARACVRAPRISGTGHCSKDQQRGRVGPRASGDRQPRAAEHEGAGGWVRVGEGGALPLRRHSGARGLAPRCSLGDSHAC